MLPFNLTTASPVTRRNIRPEKNSHCEATGNKGKGVSINPTYQILHHRPRFHRLAQNVGTPQVPSAQGSRHRLWQWRLLDIRHLHSASPTSLSLVDCSVQSQPRCASAWNRNQDLLVVESSTLFQETTIVKLNHHRTRGIFLKLTQMIRLFRDNLICLMTKWVATQEVKVTSVLQSTNTYLWIDMM